MTRRIAAFFLILALCSIGAPAAWAAATAQPAMAFSGEELQYFREKKVLRVSVLTHGKPFSYVAQDGTYQGVPLAILYRLSQKTGVSITIVPAESYGEALEQLGTGAADVLGFLTQYPNECASLPDGTPLHILPYLTAQAVLIQHKNTDLSALSTVALADLVGRHPFTRNENVAPIYYATAEECLNAVRCRQADVAVCDSFTGAALMQKYESKDLMSVPANMMIHCGLGVPADADAHLVTGLTRAIASFSKGDVARLLLFGSDLAPDNLMEFVYRYPFEILCFLVAILFVVALGLITYTKVNVRQHQALQGYEASYRLLSDTFGEAGLEYDYLNDSLLIFGKRSNLDIDERVEHLKEQLLRKTVRLSLTVEQLAQMVNDGAEGKSFSAEFQCGVTSGEWVWYRLIYTVICTTESHRRPIRLVGCLANVDGEHAEKERLMRLSSADQLTGLLNRKTAEDRIGTLLTQVGSARAGLLVVLDIDYFKEFNDQQGHLCGDDVLRSLGRAIQRIFSLEDIQCRWGGDEFLLFLVEGETLKEDFMEKVALLRQEMQAYAYQGVAMPVTLSMGGASTFPACTFALLFRQADEALYLAKRGGRNQFWLYQPPAIPEQGEVTPS